MDITSDLGEHPNVCIAFYNPFLTSTLALTKMLNPGSWFLLLRQSCTSSTTLMILFLLFKVIWADQQIVKRRVRRDYNPKLNDPDYSKQWFLVS